MNISLIVACDENNGIGYQNQLLCHLPNDLKYFKRITTGHTIVMGRKTFESIGRPLPNRTNIVLTRDQNFSFEGIVVCHHPEEAIKHASILGEEELFIIGGGELYKTFLSLASRIYLTRIYHRFEADTYFADIDDRWIEVSNEPQPSDEKNIYSHDFIVYEKRQSTNIV